MHPIFNILPENDMIIKKRMKWSKKERVEIILQYCSILSEKG